MSRENIVILDFGGPEAQLAARMVRNARVYSQALSYDASLEQIRALAPSGIVCVGGLADADAPDSPRFNKDIFSLCVPVLAMGYGARALAVAYDGRPGGWAFKGDLKRVQLPDSELFAGVSGMRRFARADRISVPKGFSVLCAVEGVVIAMTNSEMRCAAVQFTPEANDLESQRLLSNFALNVCGCEPGWTVRVFITDMVEQIRATVGSASAILPISGGVDSSVCAAVMHKAIGARAHCVMVDTGLLRPGEARFVKGAFDRMGIPLKVVDCAERFMDALSGVTEADGKRAAISRELSRVVMEEAALLPGCDYLVNSAIVTDGREEPQGLEGRFAGELSPLSELYKDEVRSCGEHLDLPEELIWRQPFPGQGYALRCMGEVTPEKLEVLRQADQIFREELTTAGHTKQLRQYFAVLADQPGSATGKYMVALRALQSGESLRAACARLPYDLLERVVERIIGEQQQVARVVYDLTGKPPSTVEW